MKHPLTSGLLAAAVPLLLSVGPAAAGPIWSFETLPASGDISGAVGSTIGWGYTIANSSDADEWLWVYSAIMMTADPVDPSVATFDQPFVGEVLPAGASVFIPFDGINGLFGLRWAPSAPIGTVISGNFFVDAAFFNANPFDPNSVATQLGDAEAIASFSALAEAGAISPVPEPGTVILVISGLGALRASRRGRRRVSGKTPRTRWVTDRAASRRDR
jgi:hypothetical protein